MKNDSSTSHDHDEHCNKRNDNNNNDNNDKEEEEEETLLLVLEEEEESEPPTIRELDADILELGVRTTSYNTTTTTTTTTDNSHKVARPDSFDLQSSQNHIINNNLLLDEVGVKEDTTGDGDNDNSDSDGDSDDYGLDLTCSKTIKRSESSVARMLIEATAYSEAIGEIPPTNLNEIAYKEIVEEDGEFDDDDDDDNDGDSDEDGDNDELKSRTSLGTSSSLQTAAASNEEVREKDFQQTTAITSMVAPNSSSSFRSNSNRKHDDKSKKTESTTTTANIGTTTPQRQQQPSEPSSFERLVRSRSGLLRFYNNTSSDSYKNTAEGTSELSEKASSQDHFLKSSPLRYMPEEEARVYKFVVRSEIEKCLPDQREDPKTYKGICANPPEIAKSGIARGNNVILHRKAWLEVSDKYHRYGKNLRTYYRHWESLGHPTNKFFDWLDSKGKAAGQPLPNLDECPRSVLDSDTVQYITNPDVTQKYLVRICPSEFVEEVNGNDGIVYPRKSKLEHSISGIVDGPQSVFIDIHDEPVKTGPDGWIFVLRDWKLYAAPKISSISEKVSGEEEEMSQRFHHSSFFGGKAVQAAGIIITDDFGRLIRLYPHSGHYRPGEAHLQRMLFYLQKKGVQLRSFNVDLQQVLHVARKEVPLGGADATVEDAKVKVKKVDNLFLRSGSHVACFLAHKALMIGEGVFAQIHEIKRFRSAPVSEILEIFDKIVSTGLRPLSSSNRSLTSLTKYAGNESKEKVN